MINFALLTLFHNLLNLPVFVSQLLGAEIALLSNFMLHHHWTYKSHHVTKSIGQLLVQFHSSSWPAILGSALMVSAGAHLLHLGDLAALAISSAIALLWNFGWSKYIIWRDMTPADIKGAIK